VGEPPTEAARYIDRPLGDVRRDAQPLTQLAVGEESEAPDEESRQALWDAGVCLPISVRPDPVGDLRIERPPVSLRGLALVVSPSKSYARRAHEIAHLCDRIAAQLQTSIDLLVFFPKEDELFARKIAQETEAIRQVRVWQNPLDLLTWIAQYQLVVATRFHALVMAGTGKIPFIGWGDQKKLARYCHANKRPYINTELGWDEDQNFAQVASLYQSRNKSVILAARTD